MLALAAMPAVSFGQTASQAQYGGVEGTVEAQPTPPSQGVLGEEPTEEAAPPAEAAPEAAPQAEAAPKAEAAPEGALPFTGQDLVLMLLAGAGLIGLGLVLRRATGRAPAGA